MVKRERERETERERESESEREREREREIYIYRERERENKKKMGKGKVSRKPDPSHHGPSPNHSPDLLADPSLNRNLKPEQSPRTRTSRQPRAGMEAISQRLF